MTDRQIKAAYIGGIAAVTAALITAIIAGTVGYINYLNSQNQIAADDKRSATEFARSQIREASAAFSVKYKY